MLKRWRYVALVGTFLLCLCGSASGGVENSKGPSWAPPGHAQKHAWKKKVVRTRYGLLKGIQNENGTWAWKGVPYARPPVGKLRWKAPKSPKPWRGVRKADASCEPCTQQFYDRTWHPSNEYVGSEDCLYLDVYRPGTEDVDLPVYVFIHGGSNNFGGAASYNGAALAERENIVVVFIQYRLATMGWMTHPALRDDENPLDASGNYGTLDTIKALKWVKKNIRAFGGDPRRVTVGGESAGAHNTLNLIMSPLAKGLFRGAAAESAAMELYSMEEGDEQTNAIIKILLMNDGSAGNAEEAAKILEGLNNEEVEAYLRSKTAPQILAANVAEGGGSMPLHSAYRDGFVLPDMTWLETIASGDFNRVPLIIGTNEYEYKSFLPLYGPSVKGACYLYKIPPVPSGSYSWGDLYEVLDPESSLTLSEVLPTENDRYFYDALGWLLSLNWKANYCDAIARALKEESSRNKVYTYLFKWAGGGALPDFEFIFGAGHAMDIPFWQGQDDSLFGYSFTEEDRAGRVALQHAMMDYLGQFVRTGAPNSRNSELLEWPQWSNEEGEVKGIVFDADETEAILELNSEEITPELANQAIGAAYLDFTSSESAHYIPGAFLVFSIFLGL